MDLSTVLVNKEYTVSQVQTGDPELDDFLFSLGCYTGEPITVISRRRSSCTVAIKDGRYHMDHNLARAIRVEASA